MNIHNRPRMIYFARVGSKALQRNHLLIDVINSLDNHSSNILTKPTPIFLLRGGNTLSG